MNYLELDLKIIEKHGKSRRDKNFDFRSFLKCQDSDKIDSIVHHLFMEISKKIDCTSCGNCCTQLKALIEEKDIERLSHRLGITSQELIDTYTEKDEGEYYLKSLPCFFLKDKICSIYDDRPHECMSYPFLHKKDIISRLWGVVDNYSFCPIVYNVYEQLKIKFRR